MACAHVPGPLRAITATSCCVSSPSTYCDVLLRAQLRRCPLRRLHASHRGAAVPRTCRAAAAVTATAAAVRPAFIRRQDGVVGAAWGLCGAVPR
eukprot:357839-Chlamydomonas_euryale.AAC.6